MTEDIELTYSPLNCTVSKDGCYSTCWEDQFETDQLAFDEAMAAIDEEGILAFVEPIEGGPLH